MASVIPIIKSLVLLYFKDVQGPVRNIMTPLCIDSMDAESGELPEIKDLASRYCQPEKKVQITW
jgi:hypothetical protein